MVKHCPSCGAEVKEGYKFCLSCGAALQPDAETQQQQPTQPPLTQQQSYTQLQPVSPMAPKKTNMKLIGAIVAIIVVVIVIALVVVLFIGGGGIGGSSNDIVGTWSYEESTTGMQYIYKFNSDGSLEVGLSMTGTINAGTWRVDGNQLCITFTVQGFGSMDEVCSPYSLSSDGRQLTYTSITFTKQ